MTDVAKAYVILVNYNGWQDTLSCIESLQSMRHPNFEIVVVDNCSGDDSVRHLGERLNVVEVAAAGVSEFAPDDTSVDGEAAKKKPDGEAQTEADDSIASPPVVILKSTENRGFAGGNNVAIRYALDRGDADYVWLLNNDTVVHRDALSELILTIEDSANSPDRIAMCGSLILDYEERSKVQTYGGAFVSRYLGKTRNAHAGEILPTTGVFERTTMPDYISGCSLLVKRECLEQIGLLNEYYFLYWEDTEWCFRCKRSGFGLAVANKSLVWHRRGSTTKRFPVSGYYNARNCLLFMREYYPGLSGFLPGPETCDLRGNPRAESRFFVLQGVFAWLRGILEDRAAATRCQV